MSKASVTGRRNIDARVVRYAHLEPCFDAFIDTRTPGSDKKENFTIIGPGVSENPNQYVHIAEPHGFNIGGARQPPNCTNSQHSHDTVEVFYVHSGTWRFQTGEHADDAQVILNPGDLISIPTNVFRGFTNVGDTVGYLWAVLGGDDPGRVLWAPEVFDMARDYGLILLDDGTLVDTLKGDTVPDGKQPMPVTSAAQVAALDVFSDAQLANCVVRSDQGQHAGGFDHLSGITDRTLIGRAPLNWPHGFTLNEVRLDAGAQLPRHSMDGPDVYFVHSGRVRVQIDSEETLLTAGDTLTVPKGAIRTVSNPGPAPACIVTVRGGDADPDIHWA
ncbi:MAG: cupin domain-containing protein [Pseudomonadota bacterium]